MKKTPKKKGGKDVKDAMIDILDTELASLRESFTALDTERNGLVCNLNELKSAHTDLKRQYEALRELSDQLNKDNNLLYRQRDFLTDAVLTLVATVGKLNNIPHTGMK